MHSLVSRVLVRAVCAPASRGWLRKRSVVSRQMGASEMLVAAGTLDSERSEGSPISVTNDHALTKLSPRPAPFKH